MVVVSDTKTNQTAGHQASKVLYYIFYSSLSSTPTPPLQYEQKLGLRLFVFTVTGTSTLSRHHLNKKQDRQSREKMDNIISTNT